VSDSGKGISAGDINKITDPFFTTQPPGKGTGLGLSISKSIVEAHNGSLEISSEEGRGTTLEVKLPLEF
jgi:two-component system NtrC family sensor kinase